MQSALQRSAALCSALQRSDELWRGHEARSILRGPYRKESAQLAETADGGRPGLTVIDARSLCWYHILQEAAVIISRFLLEFFVTSKERGGAVMRPLTNRPATLRASPRLGFRSGFWPHKPQHTENRARRRRGWSTATFALDVEALPSPEPLTLTLILNPFRQNGLLDFCRPSSEP